MVRQVIFKKAWMVKTVNYGTNFDNVNRNHIPIIGKRFTKCATMIREYDQIPTGTTPSFKRKVFRNATFTSYFGFLIYLTHFLINAFDKRAKY